MNRKTKILYIQSTFADESPNSLLWNLAKRMNKDKYEILACCMREGGLYEEKLKELGLQVKNFDMHSLLDVRAIFTLRKFIRENNIDIVHTSIRLADWFGRIAAKLAGVPLIFSTIHNNDYWRKEKKYFLYSIFDRLVLTFNTHIIAVSEGVKNFLVRWQKINPEKITVIHNGIDAEKYLNPTRSEKLKENLGLRHDMPIIGFTGRLVRQKGLDTFLQAAKYIVLREKQAQFLLVGDGPLRASLEGLAKKLKIEPYVIFAGFRTDIPEILNIMDIFFIPSLWEGHPLSIIEAMLSGKPVVASKIDGTTEVVLDQETGLLIPPGKPRAFADAICTLLDSSPDKRNKIGEKGREHARKSFSVERMVRNYENFYESYIK